MSYVTHKGRAFAMVFAGTAAVTLGGAPSAAELPRVPVLPMAMAQTAARAAVDTCAEDGHRVSVAVVDRGGVIRVLLRADGAGSHTVDSSRRKAYTAASLGEPTRMFADLIARRPELQALRDMNESILMLGGGLPVKIDGEIVGAIGVGGAPGAHLDEACARAGLQRIGADPYRPE